MDKRSLDTKVKVNNDDRNIKYLHDYIFSDDALGDGNVDGPILMCTMGSPYHYWMLRTQYPNVRIYAIEDSKLKATFRYFTSELDCNIVFIDDTSSINEWDRCIEELRKIYIRKENKDMKFRKAAVNPPYGVDKNGSNKMLHWNIFAKILEVCPEGKIAYICPIKWDRNPNKDFDWVRYEMYKHLFSYRYVDSSLFKNTKIDGGEVAIHIVDMTLEQNVCGLNNILDYVEDNKCILKTNLLSPVENKISEIMKSDNPHSFYDNRCVRVDRSTIAKKYSGDELREKIESVVCKNGCSMYVFGSRVPDKKGSILSKKGYNKGILLRDDTVNDIYNGKGNGYFLIGGDDKQYLNMLMWLLKTSKLLHKCVQMKNVSRRSTKDALSLIPDIDYTKIISVVEEYAQTNKSIDIHKIYEASNNMPTDYALLWYMIYKNNLEKTYTNNDVEEIIKYLNNK
jgi:hypothetical protein